MLKITRTVETVEEDYMGVTLRIARSNAPEFRAKFRRITKPYKRQIDTDSLPDERSIELLCEALAGTVLVDWCGEFPDGEQHPYTEALAKELLINDPDCREFVSQVAGNLSLFLEQERDTQVKKP